MNPKEDFSTIPPSAYDLIDLLDKTFPPRCMRKKDTLWKATVEKALAKYQRYVNA